METPKPVKKRRLRSFLSRNRNNILKLLVGVIVIGGTAGIAYNAGIKHGSTHPKSKTVLTSPSLEKLKEAAKNSKKNTDTSKKPSAIASTSSGFFRLAGTIQSVKKGSITIKLGDGSVVTLATTDSTKAYAGTPRTAKPVSELKSGTSTLVIGSITANGTFTASNIQAQ